MYLLSKNRSILDLTAGPGFDVSKVKRLKWQVGEKAIAFNREKTGQWPPVIPDRRIEEKLHWLANLKVTGATTPLNDTRSLQPMLIELTFENGDIIKGSLSEKFFRWISGPLANRGANLDSHTFTDFQIELKGAVQGN